MSLQAVYTDLLCTGREEVSRGVVLIEDETIRAAGARDDIAVPASAVRRELGNRILAPGFIDVHIHGGGGHDVMEGSPDALRAVARHLLRHGTTSFLPTTVSAPVSKLEGALANIAATLANWKAAAKTDGAQPLGIHLEGPFISQHCRGAHACADLQPPSIELFEKFRCAAGGWLKIMTLAPELPGAAELQQHAQRAGILIGLGHSNATEAQTQPAIAAGATHGVHVFNAMRPFAHREAGILGALLTDDRVMAEVIADGVHVSSTALRLLCRSKGTSRILLVTDAVSATGMPPGHYRLGEMEIVVGRDAASGRLECRNREGALAGSVLTQDAAVRNMRELGGATRREALVMASGNPARMLGLEKRKGIIEAGADADLVILDEDSAVVGAAVAGNVQLF